MCFNPIEVTEFNFSKLSESHDNSSCSWLKDKEEIERHEEIKINSQSESLRNGELKEAFVAEGLLRSNLKVVGWCSDGLLLGLGLHLFKALIDL